MTRLTSGLPERRGKQVIVSLQLGETIWSSATDTARKGNAVFRMDGIVEGMLFRSNSICRRVVMTC